MPTIQKIFDLEVAPEKYVDRCTVSELQELILLAERALQRIRRPREGAAPCAIEPPCAAVARREAAQPEAAKRRLRAWTAEEVERLGGMSVAAAAEYYGTTAATIYQMRSKFGLTRRVEKRGEKPGKKIARDGYDYDPNDNGALSGVML